MKKLRKIRGVIPPPWTKILRIMRLTCLFLLIGLLHVTAETYSQATRLNMELTNKKVSEVLEYIEDHSEFRFAYSAEFIDLERKVTVHVTGKTIDQVLDQSRKFFLRTADHSG